jgi:hypothetical protein
MVSIESREISSRLTISDTYPGGHRSGEIYPFFLQFLSQQLAEISAACRHVDENSLVDFYIAEWARYCKMCVFISSAFKYDNRYWVNRVIHDKKRGVYKYEDVSLLLWRENIIDPEPRVSLKVLEFIRRHREYQLGRPPINCGSAVDITSAAFQAILTPVFESFSCLPKFVLDRKHITSYKTHFHALLLDGTDKYYREIYQGLLQPPGSVGNDRNDDGLGSLRGLSIRDSDAEYFQKVSLVVCLSRG